MNFKNSESQYGQENLFDEEEGDIQTSYGASKLLRVLPEVW